MFRPVLAVAVLTGIIAVPRPVLAMGCYFGTPLTFRQLADGSKLVIYGVVDNPRQGGANGDSTDCLVLGVLKSHPIVRGKTILTLPCYIEVKDRNRPPRFLLFCDVNGGKVDPFRGIQARPVLVDYIKGLLAINAGNHAKRLRYCFDFLDHADGEIARDAFREFENTPEREFGLAVRKLPAAKLRRWLRDPKTPTHCQGMYALLLGHCGTAADAVLLRSLVDEAMKEGFGLHQILTGYVLLNRKDGWARVRKVLADTSQGFNQRYAVLRVAHYLHNNRPDVIDKQSLIEAMKLGLDQADIADIAINYLRQWRCWDLTDRILPLYSKPSYNSPVIRKAILRYATDCPRPEAVEFAAKHRKTDTEEKTFIQ